MDQKDGPVAGSVMGAELHFESDASNVEVGYWYGLKINSQTYCQFLEDTFFKQ